MNRGIARADAKVSFVSILVWVHGCHEYPFIVVCGIEFPFIVAVSKGDINWRWACVDRDR